MHKQSCACQHCQAVAGRLLNALRQESGHQSGTSMDNLKLVTAWDKSVLQVSSCKVMVGACIALVCSAFVHVAGHSMHHRTAADQWWTNGMLRLHAINSCSEQLAHILAQPLKQHWQLQQALTLALISG